MNKIRNALLIQSALGKHRDRESASTGKEGLPQQETRILFILLILDILLQTTENVGGHISLPTTAGGRGCKPRPPVSYRRARALACHTRMRAGSPRLASKSE